MVKNIGFIGLGAMGLGMSRRLIEAGHRVHGYDVRREAVDAMVESGGVAAHDAAEAARDADVLIVIVFTYDQAIDVLFGDGGAAATLPEGAVVVMNTTMAPGRAQDLAERLAQGGHRFLDAPVTGGVMGADAGTLTAIVSGAKDALDDVRDVLELMCAKIAWCGEAPGAGSTVKMINQMLCGIQVAATAEGIALAVKAGADPKVVYDVISSGAARSFVWETRVPTILARDFEPRGVVEIFTKDLDIVLQAGKSLSFPLPMTAAAQQQFLAAESQGYGRNDDGAVVKIYETLGQVDVAGAAEGEGETADD